MEEIKSIRISELKDFKNHPFHVQQDIELCALMKSIEDEGVIVPLLVRPNPDGEGDIRSQAKGSCYMGRRDEDSGCDKRIG